MSGADIVNDILRGLKIVVVVVAALAVVAAGVTVFAAVVGVAWAFLCRVVPIVLVVGLALAGVVGVLWAIGRVARALRG